jgi:uncharacterized integral membrane protein (TIGR00698 family)
MNSSSFSISRILIPVLAILCLAPFISSAIALLLGIAATLIFGNPYIDRTKKLTHPLLSTSIIGLGAGMNLITVGEVGLQGIAYTVIGITLTFIFGLIAGKLLKVEQETSLLVTVGTAICGGSAIAAVAPVIRAKQHQISVALGIVFTLNAIALFIFPAIGHFFSLSETQFGLWSALAIHDTSSVVGATLQYGPTAVQVGTTVKLARALWIVPVTLGLSSFYRLPNADPAATVKPKRPWFILGFLLMAAIMTWVPALQETGQHIEFVAKRLLVLTLFLIGSNLDRATLKSVGAKPFVQGVVLWVLAATITLSAILIGLIR